MITEAQIRATPDRELELVFAVAQDERARRAERDSADMAEAEAALDHPLFDLLITRECDLGFTVFSRCSSKCAFVASWIPQMKMVHVDGRRAADYGYGRDIKTALAMAIELEAAAAVRDAAQLEAARAAL